MKPKEILGMVEEAAGTRMFEEQKDQAKKNMGKKMKRMQEVTAVLDEEITPKLDKLRLEKRSFLQWQKSCSELERVGRMLRAWEWMELQKRVQGKMAEIEGKEKEKINVKKGQTRIAKELAAAEKDVEVVLAAREKEMKKGGKFKKLEEEVGELEKALVKIRTQVDIKNGTISDEGSKVKEMERELQEVCDPSSSRILSH